MGTPREVPTTGYTKWLLQIACLCVHVYMPLLGMWDGGVVGVRWSMDSQHMVLP